MSPNRVPLKLEWTLKRTFIEYASGVVDFQMYVADGAEVQYRNSEVFFWPARADQPGSGTWEFVGSIELVAYQGMMDVQLRDPHVTFGGSNQYLSVSIEKRSTGKFSREVIAHLTPTGDADDENSRTWEVTVSEAGRVLLGEVYPVGTSLDPLTVWFA